jgi:hypothetical protein
MNVTPRAAHQGEIINAAKPITTPVMDVRLEVDSEETRQLVKALEKYLR